MSIMEYWNKEANEGNGDNRRLKGNDIGKFKCNKSLGGQFFTNRFVPSLSS